MQLINYYDILNIEPTADLDTIKKAFRSEIALYHPDNNKSEGAKARFDLIVEGFDILSNPKKRKAYDQMLRSREANSPVLVTPEAEFQYKEWKKEAKKKSNDYWLKDLKDLLILDIFLEVGMNGLFFGAEELLDGLGDSLGDILGDIF